MKKILLTGIDGFVGYHLGNGLSSMGYNVYGTVHMVQPRNINEFWIDVTKPETFSNLPNEYFDIIIHNAGMMNQNVSKKIMFAVNSRGTQNILNFAKRNGCGHFIQISSSSIYGLKTMGQNRNESTRGFLCKFGTKYQRSKAKAENFVKTSGLNYTIIRLPAIIGKGDTFVSPTIISSLKAGSFFQVGKKDKLVTVLSITDLPQIIMSLFDHPVMNCAYNCPSNHIHWKEIIQEYAHLLKIPLPNHRKSILSIFWKFRNAEHLFLATYSKFGSHLPDNKFLKEFTYKKQNTWKNSINSAIKAYFKETYQENFNLSENSSKISGVNKNNVSN